MTDIQCSTTEQPAAKPSLSKRCAAVAGLALEYAEANPGSDLPDRIERRLQTIQATARERLG